MAKYIIRDAGGAVVNTIVAGKEFVEAHFPGVWELVIEPNIPPPVLALSKQLIIDRFTAAEWIAFSDPAAVGAVRKAYAMFGAHQGDVHPDDALISKIFSTLVQNNVLANAARAKTIMAPDINE